MHVGSEEEMQQRLAAMPIQHSMRGLFFNSVLDVLRLLEDESAVKHCLESTGETRYLDFFSYPTSTYVRLLYTAANLLGTRYGGFEGALRVMGARTIMKFLDSAAGKALQLVVEGNPQRLLNNIPVVHRMVMKGGECSMKWSSPTGGRLTIERISAPAPFIEGALQAIFDATHVRSAKVASRQIGPLDVEFAVSWE
ncbi:DUF2378 family protein [Archangium gephyra]|uniref:TIGR02265 family protein n=1 Tax=Archangium gephyra TaxID=48 RepID=UPI0035D5007B